MRHTERDTEAIVESYYDKDPNLVIERQPSLVGASKSGSGAPGNPEFIIKHKDYPEIALVVECKKSLKDHSAAEDEANHYAKFLEEKDVITLAVSGSEEEHAITMLVQEAGGEILEFKSLVSFSKLIEYTRLNKAQEEKEAEVIIEYAHKLDTFLGTDIKVRSREKPLVIASIMIALKDETFRDTYPRYEAADLKENMANRDLLMGNLMDTISRSLDKALSSNPKAAQDVKDTFNFMRSKPAFKYKEDGGHTNLYIVIKGLENHLFSRAHTETGLDIIGKFYGEFISDAGEDGSNLGIVLTPSHITDLMCDILRINIDSDIYDPCTGTGGFLVTAMSKMINMAKTDIGDKASEEEKIKYIKEKQIYGIEME